MRGKCETRIVRRQGNHNRYYQGVARLFDLSSILYTGHYTLRAGQGYTWAFKFEFPDRSAPTCISWRESVFFSSAESQPLPPSSFFRHGSDWGCIKYKVEATLLRPAQGPLFTKDHKVSQEIRFSPTREDELVDPQLIRSVRECQRATLRLNPGNEERRLKTKESLWSLFHPSRLPRAIFRIDVDVPKFAVVGDALLMFIGITHQANESTAPTSPMVRLKSCRVSMTTKTMIRCPHAFFGDEVRKWTSRNTIFDFKANDPVPLGEAINLQQLGELRTPRGLEPEFFSVCISRWYSLTVKVTIVCAKKQYTEKFKSKDLTLLSSLHSGSDPTPLVRVDEKQKQSADKPPRYQTLSPPPPVGHSE